MSHNGLKKCMNLATMHPRIDTGFSLQVKECRELIIIRYMYRSLFRKFGLSYSKRKGLGNNILLSFNSKSHKKYCYMYLSHNNPCFQCNIAIMNFLVSNTCEIRFHTCISHCLYVYIMMSSYAKNPKHGQTNMFWTLIFQLKSLNSVMG